VNNILKLLFSVASEYSGKKTVRLDMKGDSWFRVYVDNGIY